MPLELDSKKFPPYPTRQEVNAALVELLTSPGAAPHSLVYDPSVTAPQGGVFNDLNLLFDYLDSVPLLGQVSIYVPNDCSVPARTGGGAYNFRRSVELLFPINNGSIDVTEMIFEEGALVVGLERVTGSGVLISNSSVPVLTPDAQTTILRLLEGATTFCNAGKAPFLYVPDNQQYVVVALIGALIGGGTGPIQSSVGLGENALLVILASDISNVDSHAVRGPASALLFLAPLPGSQSISDVHADFAGTVITALLGEAHHLAYAPDEILDWDGSSPSSVSDAMDKLAVNNGARTAAAKLVADVATNVGAYEDLLTAAITTLHDDLYLMIYASFAVSTDAAIVDQAQLFRLDVDGTEYQGARVETVVGKTGTGAIVERVQVPAGAHTVKLKWKTTGDNARIRAASLPDEEHASLVVEVRR